MRLFATLAAMLIPGSAFACDAEAITKYIRMQKPEVIAEWCAENGGRVTKILAANTFSVTDSEPSQENGSFAILCANGKMLLGQLVVDARTCFPQAELTAPTLAVWP